MSDCPYYQSIIIEMPSSRTTRSEAQNTTLPASFTKHYCSHDKSKTTYNKAVNSLGDPLLCKGEVLGSACQLTREDLMG